jgi:hypothetical protein
MCRHRAHLLYLELGYVRGQPSVVVDARDLKKVRRKEPCEITMRALDCHVLFCLWLVSGD